MGNTPDATGPQHAAADLYKARRTPASENMHSASAAMGNTPDATELKHAAAAAGLHKAPRRTPGRMSTHTWTPGKENVQSSQTEAILLPTPPSQPAANFDVLSKLPMQSVLTANATLTELGVLQVGRW
jgi:hypothetical protein